MSTANPSPASAVARRGTPVVASRRSITASDSVLVSDTIIEVDSSGGAVVVSLLSAASVPAGSLFAIVRTNGNNAVSALAAGSDTIDGSSSPFSLSNNQVRSIWLESDGVSAWRIVGTTNTKRVVVSATILAGQSSITTSDLGLGALGTARVIAGITQAAFDTTLTKVIAIGNAGGTVTVKGEANATANVAVSILVDVD